MEKEIKKWSVYFQNPEFLERTRMFLIQKELYPLVRNWCGVKDNVRLLDVGCGTGYFTRLLVSGDENVSAVGIDMEEPYKFISQKLIDESEDPTNDFDRKVILKIIDHGEEKTLVGHGNGPIDAVRDALNSGSNVHFTLLDYSEHALTSGSSSKAASYVEMQGEGMQSAEWGVGVHANITTATIKAMISGLNRIHRDLRNKEG